MQDAAHALSELPLTLASLPSVAADAATDALAASVHHHGEPSLSGMVLASLPTAAADFAASGAVDAALHSTAALFTDMGAFVGQRMSEARSLDPSSTDSLHFSVASILDGLHETLNAEAGAAAQQGLIVLSLSLQQVLTALEGGSSSAGLDAVMGMRVRVTGARARTQATAPWTLQCAAGRERGCAPRELSCSLCAHAAHTARAHSPRHACCTPHTPSVCESPTCRMHAPQPRD